MHTSSAFRALVRSRTAGVVAIVIAAAAVA